MHICSYLMYYIYVFYRESGMGGGGGGVMDLVYGSSSSSYMGFEVNFVYECYDSPICSHVDAFIVDLVIHGCSLYGSTTFRMSTRRLPVILSFLVSSDCYILLFVAWCAYGGRGGLLFHCTRWRVNISDFFRVFCLSSSSRRLHRLSANLTALAYIRVVQLTVFVMTLANFITCQLAALQVCVFSASL